MEGSTEAYTEGSTEALAVPTGLPLAVDTSKGSGTPAPTPTPTPTTYHLGNRTHLLLLSLETFFSKSKVGTARANLNLTEIEK